MTRNGDSGVSCHHKGKAVIHRNFEMTSGSLVYKEIPIHVLLFDKERDVAREGSGKIPSVDHGIGDQKNKEISRPHTFDRYPEKLLLNCPLPDTSHIV